MISYIKRFFAMMPSRFKNIHFWIAIGAVILTALGASPEMFTNWGAVWQAMKDWVSNPFIIVTSIIGIVGVVADYKTKGLLDPKPPDSDS